MEASITGGLGIAFCRQYHGFPSAILFPIQFSGLPDFACFRCCIQRCGKIKAFPCAYADLSGLNFSGRFLMQLYTLRTGKRNPVFSIFRKILYTFCLIICPLFIISRQGSFGKPGRNGRNLSSLQPVNKFPHTGFFHICFIHVVKCIFSVKKIRNRQMGTHIFGILQRRISQTFIGRLIR